MDKIIALLIPAMAETIYMVVLSTIFATIMGLPIGLLAVITDKNHIIEMPKLNKVLDGLINIFRSIPFIILMILVLPLSRFIVGTTIGSTASIVPLSIAAAPFVARIVEGAVKEVDRGLLEASISLGASRKDIISKVLIPESLPSLIHGLTITVITLVGYSAMAGAIGGGGLGDLAIRYGYQRFKLDIMIVSVASIIILVQGIQFLGDKIVYNIRKKRG
ncbi:methionine ABC transporter permease [Ilyobacter polytropus]|uniref:Binding-protein-dependent transport systems inner membrane component n=1 Tax=Ilyobacter polytropus (strain ATCC 51220 / DSM 2926 / LMG 16218 / CuHBu1) TaxID=572544 RepID=E3H8J2_ILYPC|nr:methionine ABC transporter permease [Ilyobacter polytropus]ADO82974.1 binding-protein-dependent transport systems inner membrane component [Ilyobacter polytropus DSM 2926]